MMNTAVSARPFRGQVLAGRTPAVGQGRCARLHARTTRVQASHAADVPHVTLDRRSALLGLIGTSLVLQGRPAHADGIETLEAVEGFGTRAAVRGNLILFHYVGRLDDAQRTVFDSTRGGLRYRDGGMGVLRPAAILLDASNPIPGICAGLQQGLEGMRIGGKKTIKVPSSLAFGDKGVLAPYAYVPPNSNVTYEIELIRLSISGPDELFKGVARCGTGGASESVEKCGEISYMEV